MLLEVQWENCYTTWIYNFVSFYIAGIYVCVHLLGCQNKPTCFQKFKSLNMRPSAGASCELVYNYK